MIFWAGTWIAPLFYSYDGSERAAVQMIKFNDYLYCVDDIVDITDGILYIGWIQWFFLDWLVADFLSMSVGGVWGHWKTTRNKFATTIYSMVNHSRYGGKRNYFALFQWSWSLLLDSSYWKTHENVRESRSIGQFLLKNDPNCPRKVPYWTVLTE